MNSMCEGIRLAASMDGFRQSTLREIMSKAQGSDFISFAVGTPGTDLLPLDDLAAASSRALEGGHSVLQYGLPSPDLKARVIELMAARGVECTEDQVFLTTGAQQGMDLVSRLLLDPGDAVVLEEAIYDGIQMAVRGRRPWVLTVPSDPQDGLDVDALDELLQAQERRDARDGSGRPRFLYVIPDGHNPLGASLPESARDRLVELARRHRLPLVEDDVYGHLSYEQPGLPLRARDDRWVIYLGSFSKILAPGLRAGWIVAPRDLVPRLSALKHAADVDSTTVTQHAIVEYLGRGLLPSHLEFLRSEYGRRRDSLLAALERHFPPAAESLGPVRWNHPRSGIFVWLDLPDGADTTALLERAIEEKVAFCPGEAFAAGDPAPLRSSMRLSFADNPPERIEEGVDRLARVIAAAGFGSTARVPARSSA